MGVLAWSVLVAPPYTVPTAFGADICATPLELTETGAPVASNAKLCGAVIVLPAADQSFASSSARKASLKLLPTNCGYSSDRNLKSNARQLAPAGTLRSSFSTDPSLAPRAELPADALAP